MTNQVIPADKKLRSQVIMGLVLLAILALILIQFLQGYLADIRDIVGKQPETAVAKARTLLIGVTLLHAALSISFGIYFLTTGVRVWNARRYPLEGQRVIRDTKVRVGDWARILAVTHFLIGALLILSNVFMIRLIRFIAAPRP